MNADDFNTWLDYHCAAFPALREHLADAAQETLRHWGRALASVGLTDAKRATDLIFSGEEPRPKGWAEHPAGVRWIAKKLAMQAAPPVRKLTRFYDGQPAFTCPICCDLHVVTVWAGDVYDPIRELLLAGEPIPAKHRVTAGVFCHCEGGLRAAERSRRYKVTFNSRAMIACYSRLDEASWASLLARLAEGLTAAGYVVPECRAVIVQVEPETRQTAAIAAVECAIDDGSFPF